MDLRRLQHVVALADESNFRRAAERVHLSQPAFSRSIQAAEKELGLRLFDRGALEARPTPAGTFFVERARALLHQSERLERDMAMFREREIGDVTFGTGPFPAATLVPLALGELRKRYPHVAVRVRMGNAQDLLDCVEREEHEFFVANARRVPRGGIFQVRSLGRMRGGFYVRRGHPLLGRKHLKMPDLLPFGIGTGRLPDDVTVQFVRMMGLADGTPLPIAVECDDVHLLKQVALGSDTVIIGTDDLLAVEIGAGRLVPLNVEDFAAEFSHSQIGVVSLAGRTPSPAAAYLMDALAQIAKAQAITS
ncbi:LysR family transcriptional regulator [Ramlibacter sp. PS4R-6]|uniref:LysR family transcriptional regulator n=1 Tax=Ramlibacter sp. PS4R-6 TaxID=3133438 RepID=UPI0030A4FCCD